MHSHLRTATLVTLPALAALVGCLPDPAIEPDGVDEQSRRVVVIGDLHADMDAARGAYRLAGGIDEHDDWVGGSLVIVQLGDMIGRSYQDREVLDFIFEVRQKALLAGGTVHVVLGNHEVFAAVFDFRAVSDEAWAAYDGLPGLDRNDPRIAHLEDHQRSRAAAFMPGGPYAERLSELPTVLRLGETIFAHGGVTPHWAAYGIDRINEEVGRWLAGETPLPVSASGVDAGNLDDNVMMSRHFSRDVDEEDCALLDESLRILGSERMIVAHSPQDSITSYCDGKAWAVDVGMSRYYNGTIQVLEIIDGDVFAVVTP